MPAGRPSEHRRRAVRLPCAGGSRSRIPGDDATNLQTNPCVGPLAASDVIDGKASANATQLESRLDIIRAAAAVRGKVLNGVVLHTEEHAAGSVQRPKAPWLPGTRPTRKEQAHYAALSREPQPV